MSWRFFEFYTNWNYDMELALSSFLFISESFNKICRKIPAISKLFYTLLKNVPVTDEFL